MASQDQLEIDALTKELIALRKEASNRSVPDSKMNRRMIEIQDMIARKKSATLSTPNATYKKGGMVKKQAAKVKKVMGEFKEGKLHSGKKGAVVKARKQAVAIALSEARKVKKK